MTKDETRKKYQLVLKKLYERGLFETPVHDNFACPEAAQIPMKLLTEAEHKLTPQILAEVFGEVFELPVYSELTHGIAEARCPNDTWVYAKGIFFQINPFEPITPRLCARTSIDSFVGFGVLAAQQKHLRPAIQTVSESTDALEAAEQVVMGWIAEAIAHGASDLQIIPKTQETVLIKERVDGDLHLLEEWGAKEELAYDNICNVVLNRCGLATGTFNKLIDSGFKISGSHSQNVEVRVSLRPIFADGVSSPGIFLRFLGNSKKQFTRLADLELLPDTLATIEKILPQPDGISVFTGPTGSGKTTMLYTILQTLHNRYPGKSIQTLEDPVERNLEGIEQTQISGSDSDLTSGVDFASGLRSMMRTDVDVILVGEIRDGETARQAITAGLTGHRVLTTLHTTSALGVVDRLIDLGVERALVASWLRFVSAQRLVLRVCQHCSTEVRLADTYSLEGAYPSEQTVRIANPQGCSNCRSGYAGRILIIEAIPIYDALQGFIIDEMPIFEMRKRVREAGYLMLEDYARQLWLRGLTTHEAISDCLGYPLAARVEETEEVDKKHPSSYLVENPHLLSAGVN